MRLFVFGVLLACSLFAEAPKERPRGRANRQSTPSATAPSKKNAPGPARAQRPAPAVTIPADAVQVGENAYEKQDAQGRTWVYSRSPFGVMKSEKKAANPVPEQRPDNTNPFGGKQSKEGVEEQLTRATVAGDEVRFERKSPFGVQKWTKKRSDLNEEERQILESVTASR